MPCQYIPITHLALPEHILDTCGDKFLTFDVAMLKSSIGHFWVYIWSCGVRIVTFQENLVHYDSSKSKIGIYCSHPLQP